MQEILNSRLVQFPLTVFPRIVGIEMKNSDTRFFPNFPIPRDWEWISWNPDFFFEKRQIFRNEKMINFFFKKAKNEFPPFALLINMELFIVLKTESIEIF